MMMPNSAPVSTGLLYSMQLVISYDGLYCGIYSTFTHKLSTKIVSQEEFSLSELLADLQSRSRVHVAAVSSYSELRVSDQPDVLVAISAQ